MGIFEEAAAGAKPSALMIGVDLATLSEDELVEPIAILGTEIERLETAPAAKRDCREAASEFFKR